MGTATSTCSVTDLKAALEKKENCQVIDVRENAEYSDEHLEPSTLMPLSSLSSQLGKISKTGKTYILCRSDKRAGMAAELMAKNGLCDLFVVTGGIMAWKAAGYPTKQVSRTVWPIERQVKLVAGLVITTGAIMAIFGHPGGIFLAALVGLGLIFVALTDNCIMGLLLMQMPWNKCKTEL